MKAMNGDLAALREILDRTEGKAVQTNIVIPSDDFSNLSIEEKEKKVLEITKKALD